MAFPMPLPLAITAALLLAPVAAAQPAAPPAAADGDAFRSELHRVIAEARDSVFPALVSIGVVTVRYSGGREFKGRAVGSGTIISAAGHVLTNAHVTSERPQVRLYAVRQARGARHVSSAKTR